MLKVTDLEVRYGPMRAVHGVTFELKAGQVAAMLGSNGAGKSSTLNAISGLVRPAAGRVEFDGVDVTGWKPSRIARLGLIQVPEGRRIIGPLTVEENLLIGTANRRLKGAARKARLAEVYDLFPRLAERRDRFGGLLSGGEQQMLAFGRALMADPKVLMLDEPSMGLAPIVIQDITESVRAIASNGIPILLVEQNAHAAFDIATTALVLEHGSPTVSGSVDEVRNDPAVLRAFLGIEGTGHAGSAQSPSAHTREAVVNDDTDTSE